MEKLRRANHLWTNDNLHLRDFLLIPIAPSDHHSIHSCSDVKNKQNGLHANNLPQNCEIITRQDLLMKAKSAIPRSRSCTTSFPGDRDNQISELNANPVKHTAQDFFSKLDTDIAKIKRSVEQLDAKSK